MAFPVLLASIATMSASNWLGNAGSVAVICLDSPGIQWQNGHCHHISYHYLALAF